MYLYISFMEILIQSLSFSVLHIISLLIYLYFTALGVLWKFLFELQNTSWAVVD